VTALRAAKPMAEDFTRKHGITPERAHQLIKEHGNSRAGYTGRKPFPSLSVFGT
jgi:hypothetical protein